jgi:type IV fimbrial biogenesis protein FimT
MILATNNCMGPVFWRSRTGGNIRGFTLIELLVTLVIAGILLLIAVPAFQNVTLSSTLTSYANSLVGSAYLARSEAIKRNATVQLCESSDGTTCGGSTSWQNGWIVLAADGTVVQHQPAVASGFVVNGSASSISYLSTGMAVAGTFKICRANPTGPQERVVSLSAAGQPAISTTTTGTCP